jgi:hypothetical protein
MGKADQVVVAASERLARLADTATEHGGVAAKLAEPLADDAAFLRKLKPSLIKARIRGNAPTDATPPPPAAAGRSKRAGKSATKAKGPSALPLIGGAVVAGIALAKLLDWRGHAHPRD